MLKEDYPAKKIKGWAKDRKQEISEGILNREENELEWFSGFSEAESSFNISSKGALKFKIKLHMDDRGTLEYIKKLLSLYYCQ